MADDASDPTSPRTADADRQRSDRRGVLAGTAAAIVAATAVRSESVSAADGDALIAGDVSTASTRTELVGPSFVVTDGEASGSLAREVVPGVVTGVHGFTARDVNSRGVWGLDQTTDGVGVYGQHWDRSVGTGVVAESGNGPGLVAQGTGSDVVLRGSGELRFAEAKSVSTNSPGAPGTLARDAAGTLWYCAERDRWQRIAGPARTSTFVPIDPTRVYDSRAPQPAQGALGSGGQKILSVRDGRDIESGNVFDADIVPFDATAISYNLTIVDTVGSGFLAVTPGDVSALRASTINWTVTNQTLANAGIVKIDRSGFVRIFCGGPGGSTDFIIDVTGYYA